MKFKMNKLFALGVAFTIMAVGCVVADQVIIENDSLVYDVHFQNLEEEYETYSSGLITGIIGIVVGVAVATAILPNVFNNTHTLETDSAGDLDTNEESLIGVWNIVIIAGVMLSILAIVM